MLPACGEHIAGVCHWADHTATKAHVDLQPAPSILGRVQNVGAYIGIQSDYLELNWYEETNLRVEAAMRSAELGG